VPTTRPDSAATAASDPLADRVRALAEEAAAETDLFVVGVEVRGFQGSRVVEVFADSEAGAGADDLARLSRSLGFLLDTEDVVKGRYRLDVSTPGADRPLADRRQYAQHVGRTLDVTYDADDEEQSVTGALVGVADRQFEIEPSDGSTVAVPFDAVREARVALPW
jgi:ribosome maturation factor RimP